MGLERIASVIQQAPTDYETDLFVSILARVQSLLHHTDAQRREALVPYRVIADHGRAAVFLIADGVAPGNEGRAYVLRMILRRAIRFGKRAGFAGPFLGEVAATVIEMMGGQYPELERRREFILKVIEAEEGRFSQTLATGLDRLAEVIAASRARGLAGIPGDEVFKLYDTYGFPVEMTRDVGAESGLAIDEEGFRREMEAQRRRSRAALAQPAGGEADAGATVDLPATEFVGYTREASSSAVMAILKSGARVDEVTAGDELVVVLDRTPFYAEAGGQVGDTGVISARGLRIEITDTRRLGPAVAGHVGRVAEGRVRAGTRVRAAIDGPRRTAIRRNHTATHLLHRALQDVLGDHARQAGSLVAPDRLRFDFTHLAPLTAEEREAVQRRVNEVILAARPVRAATMSLEQARRLGAMALFGEKYGERVRVVTVQGYSRELCGGTHLSSTGQVGLFTITAEGSVAAGVRRIEAVTGWPAYERARAHEQLVTDLSGVVRAAPAELLDRVRRLGDQARTVDRERAAPGRRRSEDAGEFDDGIRATVDVNGVRVATARIDGASHEALRQAGDLLRHRLGQGVFVLGGVAGDRVNLVAMVTADLHGRGVRADALVRAVASRLGGTGGGRADLAQGGGKDPGGLDAALDAVPDDVRHLVEAP